MMEIYLGYVFNWVIIYKAAQATISHVFLNQFLFFFIC